MNRKQTSKILPVLSLFCTMFIVLVFSIEIKAQDSSLRIMFLSNHEGSVEVYTMRADGTDIQQFIDIDFEEDGEITSASLSPDGTTLAISSRKDRVGHQTDEIFLLDLATGDITMLTNDGKENTSPVWSPDSRYLAYLGDGIYGLFENVNIFDTDTQTTEVLITGTALEGALTSPSYLGMSIRWLDWSPDGSQLALAGQTSLPDGFNLMVILNADGTNARQVIPDEMDVGLVSWGSENNLLYTSCSIDQNVDEICQLNLQTLELEQLSDLNTAIPTATYPYITSLDISPEGKFILGYGEVINEPIYQFDVTDESVTLISSVTSDKYELIGWVDISSIPCTAIHCYAQP